MLKAAHNRAQATAPECCQSQPHACVKGTMSGAFLRNSGGTVDFIHPVHTMHGVFFIYTNHFKAEMPENLLNMEEKL